MNTKNFKVITPLWADWCYQRHRERNHYYDGNIPYERHLKLAVKAAHMFQDDDDEVDLDVLEAGASGHDLIDDRIASYSEVLKQAKHHFSQSKALQVAEIILSLANPPGRNYDERNPQWFYDKMRKVPGARKVKLADRMANVWWGSLMDSSEFHMYKEKNPDFLRKMGLMETPSSHQTMVDTLCLYFNDAPVITTL